MALLYALWTAALLALLAAGWGDAAQTQAVAARSALAIARAQAAADGALQLGLLAALDADPRLVQAGQAWRAVPGGRVLVRIEEEGGKVDLNHAPPALLAALFAAAGAQGELTEVVLARRAAMRALGRPGFALAEELGGLPGIDPALADRLARVVTVLSRAEVVDPAVAPRLALLAATGRGGAEVDAFIAGRAARGRLARLDGPHVGPLLGAGLTLRAATGDGAVGTRALLLKVVPLGGVTGAAVIAWWRD